MDDAIAIERAARITALNDATRRSFAGTVMTPGVMVLTDVLGLMRQIYEYFSFTANNDHYGEHNFGSLDWHGERIFWKIDYYDPELKSWCDPLAPECRRVMTVMLASEY